MEDLKPVYIVSLGPGEAGLISLIGGAALCRANAIFARKQMRVPGLLFF